MERFITPFSSFWALLKILFACLWNFKLCIIVNKKIKNNICSILNELDLDNLKEVKVLALNIVI